MRKLLSFLCLIITSASVAAQQSNDAWFKANYTKKEIYIPMRDGVKLFTAFYIPKDSTEKHPFLISRTPYSCSPYGEDKFTGVGDSYRIAYLKEGYIMVFQDVRGRFMSEGVFEDVRPFNKNKTGSQIDEASDTYDADFVSRLLYSSSMRRSNLPHHTSRQPTTSQVLHCINLHVHFSPATTHRNSDAYTFRAKR